MSTGRSVNSKDWNQSAQQLIENEDSPENKALNSYLADLAIAVKKKYLEFTDQGIIPSPQELKRVLQLVIKNKSNVNSEFWNLFEVFVAEKKTEISNVTDYDLSLRKHLKNTEILFNQGISFDNIKKRRDGFFQQFEEYLTHEAINIRGTKGLALNTIGKQIKNLKVFLNWCFDNNHLPPFSLKPFVTKTEDIDTVFLSAENLESIRKVELIGEQDIIRDLFLIGCETGLRYSDFINIKPTDFRSDILEVRPKKTRKAGKSNLLLIPVSAQLKKIIEKYKGIPPQLSVNYLNRFNQEIREICKKAGIVEKINISRIVTGKETHETKQKWELISSHSCRRTFCTLKFLAGMPVHAIMKFSGHKTERNFVRYLRLDAQLNAEHYKSFFS
jgi:integrase